MGNNSIDYTLAVHEKRLKKLSKIEDELIALISEHGHQEIKDKFLEYLNQKNLCNATYLKGFNILKQKFF